MLYRLTRYRYDLVGNITKEIRCRGFQTAESVDGAMHGCHSHTTGTTAGSA